MKTLSVLLAALLTATISARPPNVVVIFIDDMGYGDIGPFGATKQRTPH
ncbi:arylsulfatase, partial [bacterium]|nr:arylsulfatase [bacterium]